MLSRSCLSNEQNWHSVVSVWHCDRAFNPQTLGLLRACPAEEACEANAGLARWHHHSGGAHPRVECCPAGSCDGVRICFVYLRAFLVLVNWTAPEASLCRQGTRLVRHSGKTATCRMTSRYPRRLNTFQAPVHVTGGTEKNGPCKHPDKWR